MDDLISIQSRLQDFLIQRTGEPEPCPAALDLIATGFLDSLMLMDLVLFIQSEFHVQLGSSDVVPGNFRNIIQLSHVIHERQRSEQAKVA